MRALITAPGYIGSRLAATLQDQGDRVITARVADPGFETILRTRRPDVIVHQGDWGTVPEPGNDNTIEVLEAALAYGQRVILLSTAAVYGKLCQLPATEWASPLPVSRYGELARQAEETLSRYNRIHRQRHTILRLSNVYGPGHPVDSVIPEMAEHASLSEHPAIYGDGSQTRDFIFAGDAVQGILAAMRCPVAGAWNVGTGIATSINQLAALIAEVTKFRTTPVYAGPQPGDIRHSVLSVAQAERDLGWHACTSLPDGLRQVCGA